MKPLFLLGISLALSACAKAPEAGPEHSLAPAADPAAGIRHIHAPDLLAGYTARPVGEPQDWRTLNDRQSPAAREDD